MRRLLLSALSCLVIALGLSVPASPALANGTNGSISKTGLKLCVNDNYSSCLERQKYDKTFTNDCFDSKCWAYNSVNDDFSSFVNYSDYWWKMYEDSNYKGFVLCVRPHGYDRDLGNNTKYEDDISSVKRISKTKPTGCDQVVG